MSQATRDATRAKNTSSRFPIKEVETLAADRDVTQREMDTYQGFFFDPGGSARNVDLPAAAANKNAMVIIVNKADAAETITVRNEADSTVATVAQNEAAILFSDGSTWASLVGANT